MTLKDLLEKHSFNNCNYEINIYALIGDKELYCDYADSWESPWRRYLVAYLEKEVINFGIVINNSEICLRVLIKG